MTNDTEWKAKVFFDSTIDYAQAHLENIIASAKQSFGVTVKKYPSYSDIS